VSERDDLPDVRATVSDVDEPRAAKRLPGRRPEAAGVEPAAAPLSTPHAKRFQIFTGVLLALAIAAVTGALVVAAGGGGGSAGNEAGNWSAFRPSSDGLDTGAREIADYVGRQYLLPTGQQIVLVTGGPLEIQGLPMRIAVRHSPADGGQIDLLSGGGVLYRLCGLGPKCAISSGQASTERLLLLRREALELALYSFHDLKHVENVVVLMPPPPKGTDPTVALHFRRGDVAGQLARPLRATLPSPVPTPDTIDQSPDTPFVQALTFGNMFKFSFTQANQDTSVFLVLDPLPTDS
jgi:hypothetical protein